MLVATKINDVNLHLAALNLALHNIMSQKVEITLKEVAFLILKAICLGCEILALLFFTSIRWHIFNTHSRLRTVIMSFGIK
jgi:hypothetical protein